MNTKDEIFGKVEDENGREYYCPMDTVADRRKANLNETDNCVEASTAGRYSGRITVVDRFVS